MQQRLLWLADALRAAGLRVVEQPGWQTRGRPPSTGNFVPSGVLIHHTAGATTGNFPSLPVLINGRADLPGPLAQLGIARDGTVYVIAAGRANHAGRARESGPMPAGDGNAAYVGIECENTGRGETWSKAQIDAMVRASAAVCRRLGVGADHVRGHKETSTSGKIDPAGVDMGAFRQAVARRLAPELKPAPMPKEDLNVDIDTLRKVVHDETLGARYREYVDQDGNGKRDIRSVSDILYSTHAAVVELNRAVARLEAAVRALDKP